MCNKLFRSICDYTPIYTVSYSRKHDFFISIIVRGKNIALTHSPKLNVKVPLHAMKPHGKVVAHLYSFWNLVLGGGDLSPSCTDCFTPEEICRVPTEQDVGWTPERVCKTLQEDRSLFTLRKIETRSLAGSRRNQHHLMLFAIITLILLGQLVDPYTK
jgi:hypothetical protein